MTKSKSLALFSLFVLLFCVLLSFSVGATEGVQEIGITIVAPFPVGDPSVYVAEKFKEEVEKESNGVIQVEVLTGSALGGAREAVEATRIGAAQAISTGFLPVTMFTDKYGFFDGTYVFEDFEHFKRCWYSDIGDGIRDILLDNNLRVMDVYFRGFRHLAANTPVKNPDDVRGIKIRVPGLPSWVKVWKEIGALPTPVALSELYSALETGVVDAAEGPLSQMVSYHYEETLDYLILTQHNVAVASLYFNNNFYQGLSAKYKEIIDKAAAVAIELGAKEAREQDMRNLRKLEEGGMNVIELDADSLEAFRKKIQPVIDELFKEVWTVTTREEIMKYAE